VTCLLTGVVIITALCQLRFVNVVCYRRDECTPAIIWSALTTKSVTKESSVELLESGSSTPVSAEHGDDVDSSSVTTSSSSDVTAVGDRRDRGVGLTARGAIPRPRYSVGLHALTHSPQHPLTGSAARPTYFKNERRRAAHDNDGFVSDEMIVKSAEDTQSHPLQQQQPATTAVADARTHCVSVELHTAPRELAGPDAGNESMI